MIDEGMPFSFVEKFVTMAGRTTPEEQWDLYAGQTDIAKQRAMDRLALVNQVEALVDVV